FFSRRRRHTRSTRDWSSDVCSSDLGLLVPPGDPVALAQGIIRIIEDPEMARLFGGRGREEIRARYGVQRLASDLGRLYCDLLARKGIRLQETGKSVDGMA